MFRVERHVIGNSSFDAGVVQLIRSVFVGEGYTPEAAATAFDAPLLGARGALWIAVADDAVVGTVFLVEATSPFCQAAVDGESEIHLLAVSPAKRNTGVGGKLMEAALAEAARRRMAGLVLSTQPSMTAAHALYTKVGFRRAPQRDRIVPDGRTYWVFERPIVSRT